MSEEISLPENQTLCEVIIPPTCGCCEMENKKIIDEISNETVSKLLGEETKQTPLFEQFKRNNYGLLDNIKYIFGEDGFVDWRAMIPIKFLYLNPEKSKQIQEKYGKPVSEIDLSQTKVDDGDLTITLAGIKYLAKLRGYSCVSHAIPFASPEFVVVNCDIAFLPNFETDNKTVSFSDSACAHFGNTTNFGRAYLVEIATNRAFCRCVRNFLNISIVSKEELGNKATASVEEEPSNSSGPYILLKEKMKLTNVTFEQIKNKLIKEKYKDAESLKSVDDLPKIKILELISRLAKKFET